MEKRIIKIIEASQVFRFVKIDKPGPAKLFELIFRIIKLKQIFRESLR